MSDDEIWGTKSEKQWYEPEQPERGVSKYRIIGIVCVVAIFLILIGMPIYDPISFAFVLAVFSVIAIIDGLCNRELVRSLRGNR